MVMGKEIYIGKIAHKESQKENPDADVFFYPCTLYLI